MIAELVVDIAEQLLAAAINAVHYEYVEHSGPPARYVIVRPCHCGCGKAQYDSLVMVDGQSIRVSRSARLLVEPCDSLRARPIEVVLAQWTVT